MQHNRLIKILTVFTTTTALLLSQINLVFAATSNVSPSSVTIGIGQTRSVNIIATNGSDSNAADVVVSYNANIIEAISISPGPDVTQVGGDTTSPNFTITVFKSGGNFDDGEVLAVITFRGKATGTTTLSTSGTDLQPGGNTSPGAGQVTVTTEFLPDSGIADTPEQLLLLLAGGGALGFGLFLAYKTRRQQMGQRTTATTL